MPTWGDLIREINEVPTATLVPGTSPLDVVRRKYIGLLHGKTERAVIVYATCWTNNQGAPPQLISIGEGDVHGLMEAVHNVKQSKLDLIVHSPGGSPTAAEAMVNYLRTKFDDIRVIVPHMAMSAATMIACAADVIMMGKHSCLGPIDPQIQMNTALGPRIVPAQAIIEQFERAKKECQDPTKIRAWLPMLSQYGPELLVTCEKATELGQHLVSTWLQKYHFAGDPNAEVKSAKVAEWLANHDNFKAHSRPLTREKLEAQGLKIEHLEADQDTQDLVLSVYHMLSHTFANTAAAKIIENHLGKAYIQQWQQMQFAMQPAQQVVLPANLQH